VQDRSRELGFPVFSFLVGPSEESMLIILLSSQLQHTVEKEPWVGGEWLMSVILAT
jgi:hypothetical protein